MQIDTYFTVQGNSWTVFTSYGTRGTIIVEVKSLFYSQISAWMLTWLMANLDILRAGKYLSYDEWSKDTSARSILQSAAAKRPRRWRLSIKDGTNRVTLRAVRHTLCSQKRCMLL